MNRVGRKNMLEGEVNVIHIRSAFAILFRDFPHAAPGAHGRVVAALVLLLTFTFAATARAQCAAGWVPLIGAPGITIGSSVYATVVLPGGDVIAGGDFTAAGGVPANNIARYNPSTGAWSALGSGTHPRVLSLVVLPGGDVVAGGQFNTAGGISTGPVARYNPTCGAWSSLGLGLTGAVNALAVLPDGNLIVGGRGLTTGAGQAATNIARYSPSTGLWSPLGGGVDSDVQAVVVMPSGDVIAGGRFAGVGGTGGVIANGIARFNTTTLAWSALGSGVNDFGTVWALAVLPGGDVVAGGRFASIGGVSVNRIARYNFTTGVWSPLGAGVQAAFPTVYSFLVRPSGDLVVGGLFNTAGGAPAANIARYNLASGAWSALGSGTNSTVLTLTALSGGDAIAGGFFTTAGGPVANFIARYSFGTPAPTIGTQPSSQTACPTGAAAFSVTAPGTLPIYQWQLETAPNTWANASNGPLPYNGGATGTITASGVTTNQLQLALNTLPGAPAIRFRCIVTNACGSVTSNPATLTVTCPCDACPADFNMDGGIDGADVGAFFASWESGACDGDVNMDGGVDGADVSTFFAAWEAGGC